MKSGRQVQGFITSLVLFAERWIINMNQCVVLLSGLFILLIISFLRSKSDFFNPSFIVCLIFVVSTFFALYAVTSWNIDNSIFTWYGTFVILSGVSVFMVFEHIAMHFSYRKGMSEVSQESYQPIYLGTSKIILINLFSVFAIALYIYYVYRYVRANGYSSGLNFSAIGDYYHDLTFIDTKKGSIPGFIKIIYEFANAIMYICVYIFLYNVVLCKTKINKNIFLLFPILFYLPRVIVTSSRTNLIRLAGASVLYIYIFINRRNEWKHKKRNFRKIAKISSMSFVGVLTLFYLAIANGWIGRSTEKSFFDAITVYVGAPIIHFYQFIASPPADVIYFGQETFHGLNQIFVKLGLRDTYYSVQLERRRIGLIEKGNVYTFFRRPLHDFGIIGMYIVTAITGFMYSSVYYKKIYKRDMTYKSERTLIIYGYWFYVIYLFPIMNNYCNFFTVTMAYFIAGIFIGYDFLVGGKVKFKLKKLFGR